MNCLFLRDDVTYWTENVARFSQGIQKIILGATQEPKKYKPSHSATRGPKKSKYSHSGGIVEHDDNDSFSSHFELDDVNGENVPPRDNNTMEYMLQYSVPS